MVEDGEEPSNSHLLLILWKTHYTLERIFCRNLHVIFCTLVYQGMKVIIHSGILLKIALDEIGKHISPSVINRI